MTTETIIAAISLGVALIGTPCAVVVSMLVFRAVIEWRVAALEIRVNVHEAAQADWRDAFQGVRDEIAALRVEIERRLPKEAV